MNICKSLSIHPEYVRPCGRAPISGGYKLASCSTLRSAIQRQTHSLDGYQLSTVAYSFVEVSIFLISSATVMKSLLPFLVACIYARSALGSFLPISVSDGVVPLKARDSHDRKCLQPTHSVELHYIEGRLCLTYMQDYASANTAQST